MPRQIDLNDGWAYMREPGAAFFQGEPAPTEPVRLPHTGTELPYNYTDERQYQYVSGYRKTLSLPPLVGGRRLFVRFEGAAQQARLVFNGVTLKTHGCGYTAFAAELTGEARDGENLLALELDSREELDIPPFGNVVDYLTYQGLYRGCKLLLTGPAFTADVFVRTRGGVLYAELSTVGAAAAVTLSVTGPEGEAVAEKTEKLSQAARGSLPAPAWLPLDPASCEAFSLRLDCGQVRRWDTRDPALYTLTVALLDGHGETVDTSSVRFGFREAEFRADGFYLNGEKLRLRGLDRHQSFPYVGYAMPDSVQAHDAEILRRELGLNVVRTSHYPQSQAFLDRCDELGLLVFTEIPGWQHIGGDDWKDQAARNVADMVAQNRNHPSVILWGVRINESRDDDALYTRLNALAHGLDPSRQTGGVRYIRQSSFLEDVYTYNDFSHTGQNPGLVEKGVATPDETKPYLVTEYCGHMYPTKSFDSERIRLEHALRHARVLDAMYGGEGVSGCIGWCAFDYNTHKEFGSGDRICYHGVMDMFRNPKPAAAVYASQSEYRPVLEIASTMDKGEYPGGTVGAVWAFTNGDAVRLYRDGALLREFYPDRERFPNLPHPPVCIDDFVGGELAQQEQLSPAAEKRLRGLWAAWAKDPGRKERSTRALERTLRLLDGIDPRQAAALASRYQGGWGDGVSSWRFEAVKNGQVIAAAVREPVEKTVLRLDPERTTLRETGMWDAALVRITAEDQNGNRLWFAGDPLLMKAEGPLRLIGPQLTALRGGAAGVWVRTTGEKGAAKLSVAWGGTVQSIQFTIE